MHTIENARDWTWHSFVHLQKLAISTVSPAPPCFPQAAPLYSTPLPAVASPHGPLPPTAHSAPPYSVYPPNLAAYPPYIPAQPSAYPPSSTYPRPTYPTPPSAPYCPPGTLGVKMILKTLCQFTRVFERTSESLSYWLFSIIYCSNCLLFEK